MTETEARERSVLGGMMLRGAPTWDVLPILSPADFADWRNETIYRVIVGMLNAGRPVDPATVSDALASAGELDRIGGPVVLHQMTGEVPTASNIAYYAEAVAAAAVARRLEAAGFAIAALGSQPEGDVFERAERARELLDAAVATPTTAAAGLLADDADAAYESLSAVPRYIPSPWLELNDLIDGFRPGALYVIGARPGSGKTIMGLQIAEHIARRTGGLVGFSSLEMSRADLWRRLYAMTGNIHLTAIAHGQLTVQQKQAALRARDELRRLPLAINDRAGQNVTQIAAYARTVAHSGVIRAFVVDYIQLVMPTDPKKPRWETVGQISAALKGVARNLDIPVVALAQLNRETDNGSRLPGLADLRESGNIEQDADVVLLLQRAREEDDGLTPDEVDAVVAKNRHGSTGKTTLRWEGQYARIDSFVRPQF